MEKSIRLTRRDLLRNIVILGALATAPGAICAAEILLKKAADKPRVVPAVDLVANPCGYEGQKITTKGLLGEAQGHFIKTEEDLLSVITHEEFRPLINFYDDPITKGVPISPVNGQIETTSALLQANKFDYSPPREGRSISRVPVAITGKVAKVESPIVSTTACYVEAERIDLIR